MTEKSKKYILFLTKIFLIILTIVYPFFMTIMTGTGIIYNYKNYSKEVFYIGISMIVSGILMTSGTVFCLLKKKKFNILSVILWIIGILVCMITLYKLCVYADFNGWNRNLLPVSNMYKSRILPVILPFLLDVSVSQVQIHANS